MARSAESANGRTSRIIGRLLVFMPVALLAGALAAVPVASGAPKGRLPSSRLSEVADLAGASGTSTPGRVAGLYRRQGYLVPDQAAYEQAKRAAASRASTAPRAALAAPSLVVDPVGAPSIFRKWEGVHDLGSTPPDTTGAIGPTRYVELINARFAIFDRTHDAALSTGTLRTFAGAPTNFMSDPQVIWDPGTNRFYFTMVDFSGLVGATTRNALYIGFSKTSSPTNGSSDWCRYVVSLGSDLADYPKLGDSSAFMLIGSNYFDSIGDFLGAGLQWVSKPPSGSTCPSASTFKSGLIGPMMLDDGITPAWTPVPANQTDTTTTGYVVASDDVGSGGSSDFIDVYRVTKNSTGHAVLSAPTKHTLGGSFSVPPAAPQSGSSEVLDTLDGRLTQAVSATDPFRGGLAIWTQHTVAGGAGSMVEWYEINPATSGYWRTGAVSDGTLDVFNAAVSPDRKAAGTTHQFGDAFVIGFNTSASSDFPRIQMVSGYGDYVLSPFVDVTDSGGFNEDASCTPPCRWGDYSAATPDPGASSFANHGQIWLGSQWNVASADSNGVDWRTENWATHPVPYVTVNQPGSTYQTVTSFPVGWTFGNGALVADVRYRSAPWNGGFGAQNAWQSQTSTTGATFAGATGHTYCFSAQSYDQLADTSYRGYGWSGERCTAVPVDDLALSVSSGWARKTGSGFFNGTFTSSSTAGSAMTKSGVAARRIAVMVEKCSTCGSIRAYWGSTLLGTWSLHAATIMKKVYIQVASFSSAKTGTLKIVDASGHVIIDAVAISRV